MSEKNFTEDLLKMIVPEDWIKIFNLKKVTENKNEYNVHLEEKAELIPVALRGQDCVLNGYCRKLELMSFPLK